METTFTQRDKALLLILAIIIIAFAAVMVPSYGIYALISSRSETKTKILEQTAANEEKLRELMDNGVNPMFAENAGGAKRNLEDRILEEKYKIAKLSPVIESSVSSAITARDWLSMVKYLNYISGDKMLFDNVSITENDKGYMDGAISLSESVMYDVDKYTATVECSIDSLDGIACPFTFDYKNLNNIDYFNPFASYIVLASQLTRRGSIYVESVTFDVDSSDPTTATIPVIVYRPMNSRISEYANNICECSACGSPYYKETYLDKVAGLAEGESVKCTHCETGIWDGNTIN